jgi:hypothetical protein
MNTYSYLTVSIEFVDPKYVVIDTTIVSSMYLFNYIIFIVSIDFVDLNYIGIDTKLRSV